MLPLAAFATLVIYTHKPVPLPGARLAASFPAWLTEVYSTEVHVKKRVQHNLSNVIMAACDINLEQQPAQKHETLKVLHHSGLEFVC
jgi:hypothetical protein